MAYTYDQLVLAYAAVHDGIGPDAATQATFQLQAVMSANGQLTDAQLLGNIVNSADASTGLAVLAYQFFTGKSPTKAGIDYLVNSSVNTSDLNDAYYSKFSLENRYINFAANLGVQGEGAANFAAKYSALSFGDYVASIYQTIIGASYATAAGVDPTKAIADIVSRKDAILATAVSAGMIPANATAAQIDIALKAATAGYLLGEAIKADVGLYAAAANNFMVAVVQGTATYNTDITISYQPAVNTPSHGTGKALDNAPANLPAPTPPVVTAPTGPAAPVAHAFVLTAATDRFTGESLVDTFTGTDTTFTAGDTLDGAGGADTLTITGSVNALWTVTSFAGVSNIETINLSNTSGIGANVSTATGVQTLTVTASGAAAVTVAGATDTTLTVSNQGAAAVRIDGGHNATLVSTGATTGAVVIDQGDPNSTGDVNLTRTTTGAVVAGGVSVNYGKTITVTQLATNAVNTTQTNGVVTVNGGFTTTSVNVHATAPAVAASGVAGVAANTVAITDINAGGGSTLVGKITTVDVDGYTTLTVTDNALSNLTAARGSGDITVNNASALASGSQTKTLNLSLNAITGGALIDSGVYTRLNVTTGATASTLANIAFGALTALNLGGASNLTLTSTSGLTALQTVTVTGAGGITADLSGATVTAIDASASTGANTVTIDPSKATYTGGSGVDRVTYTAAGITKAISLGDGDDFLDISSASGISGLLASGGGGTGDTLRLGVFDAIAQLPHFTDFERLELVNTFGSGFVDLGGVYRQVTIGGGNLMTLAGLTTGDTLLLNSAGSSYILAFNDPNPTLNLQLADNSGADVNFASSGITASALATINITTAATTGPNGSTLGNLFVPDLTTLNLGGAGELTLTSTTGLSSLQTVTVTGAAGITANLSNSSVRSVDASATTGDNTVTIDPNTATYAGGWGVDRVTLMGGNIGKAISLGAGDDVLDAANMSSRSNVTVDGGAGTGDLVRLNSATANDLASFFTGFEHVELVGFASTLVNLGAGYNHIAINGPTNLSLTGVESGATVVVTGPGTAYSISPTTLHATLNLQLKDSSGAGVNFASTGFFVQSFETVNFTVTDGQATPSGGFMDTLILLGSSISKTVNISGNAGVALVSAGSNPATIDASGITLGGFSWTAPSLTGAATIKGSATGTNTLDFSATSHGVTYTGGTGADIIKVGVGANTIDVGIDNSVDKVLITRETTQTDFITINHLAAGDQIHLPGMGVGSPDPPLTAVVTATPGSLMNQINGYAAYATMSSAAMFFIQVGGDTYIFEDRYIGAAYNPGTDILIKLTGVTLTAANYDAANTLITI